MSDVMPNVSSTWPAAQGPMADRIRTRDWSASPVGHAAYWPSAVRSTIDVCLALRRPAWIVYGPARVQFFNDSYAELIGAAEADARLGRAADTRSELWRFFHDDIVALLDDDAVSTSERVVSYATSPDSAEARVSYVCSAIPDVSAATGIGGALFIGMPVHGDPRSSRASAPTAPRSMRSIGVSA